MASPFDPTDFLIPPGITHLCAGGKTPALRTLGEALGLYLADKSDGPAGDARQEAMVARLRARLARDWGCPVADIGFASSVAEGVAMLAESLDWRPGDEVALADIEYPSLAAPFAMRPEVTLRVSEGYAGLPDVIGPRTRVIAASSVSFLNAECADLYRLRALADSVGAMLVLDHTQAAGWMPIEAGIADFSFAACYKWLLGISGIAIAHWNRARQPGWRPASAGWYSMAAQGRPDWNAPFGVVDTAMAFCRGNPCHAGVYALGHAMDYAQRRAPVAPHVLHLAGELRARCLHAGLPVMTPERHGASVCLPHPEAAAAVAAMEARGVLAWNGRGRIRVSFHGYNREEDAAWAAAALKGVF
jgi:selenocysteine lyase/cysteine desulfurase